MVLPLHSPLPGTFGGGVPPKFGAMIRDFHRATPTEVEIEIVGFNVLAQHFAAAAQAVIEGTQQVLGVSQIFVTEMARAIVRDPSTKPVSRSGVLLDSIQPVDANRNGVPSPTWLQFNSADIWADVGAGGSTPSGGLANPAAFVQEFGFFHVGAGQFIQHPFMIPALTVAAGPFVEAMSDVAGIVHKFPQNLDPSIMGTLNKFRGQLYSLSRALGDVQVFAGSPFIGGVRTASLSAARGLGDLNATMKGAIAFGTRLETRFLGSLASGLGRSPIASASFGPASNRIYNRFAGKGFGMGLRQLSRS